MQAELGSIDIADGCQASIRTPSAEQWDYDRHATSPTGLTHRATPPLQPPLESDTKQHSSPF